MDSWGFWIGVLSVWSFVLAGIRMKDDDVAKYLFPFLGVVIPIFLIATVNSDGGIVVHYPAFSTDTTVKDPVWPNCYWLLFGLIANAAVGLRNGLS